ncbi:MAG: tyrosine-type recombinase/integrase [Candidatus Magasanikbacteria bacterium]|nr:tyrosine-type recombinase/integrase [Candidatus Magasanikbacteria bacterium]
MNKSSTLLIKQIPNFLDYCEVEKGLSPVTTKNYYNFLKMFTGWLKDNHLESLKPHELTQEHVWNYRLYLSRKKDAKGQYNKKTTQNYYLIALRNLLAYFTERDIQALPSNKIKLPKLTAKEKSIKFLTYEQIEKLLSMPDIATKDGLRDRAIMETLFSTGMRVSELTSLNIRLFDTKNIITGKFSNLELSISGKGGSVRTVYFSKRALNWLGAYLKTRQNDMCPPLFINYKKNKKEVSERRLTPRSIERLVRHYTAMAGLPVDATPHTLRHSFATDLLNGGADMRSVQELLGHKNIVTTQIYTHVTNKKLQETYLKFHGGNKK